MKSRLIAALIFFVVPCLSYLSADVYRWADEQGNMIYGNTPPSNARNVKLMFKERESASAPAADAAAQEEEQRSAEAIIQELEEEKAREEEARKEAESIKRNAPPGRDELIAREKVRLEKKIAADRESIATFEANLRELLLSSPAGMKPTLGVDPGFRTGCKVATVDPTGRLLHTVTIYPHAPQRDIEGAKQALDRDPDLSLGLVGRPEAIASRRASPNPSSCDGARNIWAIECTFSGFSCQPGILTISARRFSRINFSKSPRWGPSPTRI